MTPETLMPRAVALFERKGDLTSGDLATLLRIKREVASQMVRGMVAANILFSIDKGKGILRLCDRPAPVAPVKIEKPPTPEPAPPIPSIPFDQWDEDELRKAMIAGIKARPKEPSENAPDRAFAIMSKLIPEGEFTSVEIARASGLKERSIARNLHILCQAGIVHRLGEKKHRNDSGNWSSISVWRKASGEAQ
jgi:predicted HTH transcriptional regulator